MTAAEVARGRGIVYLLTYKVTTDTEIFLRKLNHFYSYVYAKVFNRPLFHVIGDSHTWAFKRQRSFIVHNIGPATAYNLVNKNSSVQSNRKLFEVIRRIDIKKDVVIMVFGEIDCRVHFYNQHMKSGGKVSIEELMDRTIANYGEVLAQLKGMGVNFVVYGVLPASKHVFRFPPYATEKIKEDLFSEFRNSYPFLASPEVRSPINRRFNQKLKTFCEAHGYRYLDIYPVVADDRGLIKDEFAADEIHVTGKIMPYVKSMLEKQGCPKA
ncbi:SGNH/GDSL hydrolase family protein [Methanocella arvoryzae]|uniref:SGNH hydrolase-type esterase domain-containing protein n=1 Tax=Methanocella arvoryzae (strain DSM 22066 / NBRC 105507 / MRE50) TaxID=351160 RepID=Q0W7C0_METAR|nr:SGNH/GDSL hydrolase family protein [Methanocella arvoryzae]CAH04770.1 hypothetical protein orf5 [uncultured archaeon]CAJ35723.1 hypothetical protein RCIX253 [Methanocella arvoryzae MRE50]